MGSGASSRQKAQPEKVFVKSREPENATEAKQEEAPTAPPSEEPPSHGAASEGCAPAATSAAPEAAPATSAAAGTTPAAPAAGDSGLDEPHAVRSAMTCGMDGADAAAAAAAPPSAVATAAAAVGAGVPEEAAVARGPAESLVVEDMEEERQEEGGAAAGENSPDALGFREAIQQGYAERAAEREQWLRSLALEAGAEGGDKDGVGALQLTVASASDGGSEGGPPQPGPTVVGVLPSAMESKPRLLDRRVLAADQAWDAPLKERSTDVTEELKRWANRMGQKEWQPPEVAAPVALESLA